MNLQADIICVGNELLTGLVENSNSGFIARRLCRLGIKVRESIVVGDDPEAIREAFIRALAKSDLIILTGGLGPTEDDLTRPVVAELLGRKLIQDREWLENIENYFRSRGIDMPANNVRQAERIDNGVLLGNDHGTAPGQLVEEGNKTIVLLPGPPNELEALVDQTLIPYLLKKNHDSFCLVRTLKCTGIGESALEELINSAGKCEFAPISYVTRGAEIDLQLKGSGKRLDAEAAVDKAETKLKALLGDKIFGSNDDTLAGVTVAGLIAKRLTVATAESCTGGLLADTITDIPGSSQCFRGGYVVYTAYAKNKMLGLERDMLVREGEVSEATARAMAAAVRERMSSDYGVGVTGLAGPGSDESGKKIGLVYIALASNKKIICRKLNLRGGRRFIKIRSVQIALDLLRVDSCS